MTTFVFQRCWTTNTYHVPLTSWIIPDAPDQSEEPGVEGGAGRAYIAYYQWVVPIMFAQTILLYLPTQFWRFCTNMSGYHISNIIGQ